MTDIPLATILRINAARTIPLARYEEEGNFDRFGYINPHSPSKSLISLS